MIMLPVNCPASLAEDDPVDNYPEATYSDVTPGTQPRLTLEGCYRMALEQSELIAIQKQEISRATAKMFEAASEALPDVNYVMTRELQEQQNKLPAGYSVTSTGALNDPDKTEQRFTISQPLFKGFKAVGAISGSGSFRKEQVEIWKRSRELLYQDVSRAYYGLIRYRKEIRIMRDIIKLLKQRTRELEDRVRIGRSRESEVSTVMTRLKTLEANLAGAKGELAAVQYTLEFLIGMEVEGYILSEDEVNDPSSRTLEYYIAKAPLRSDVQAAEQAVKTAWRGILVAQSGFWPTINLDNSVFTRREGSLGNVDWNLLFTMTVPIFSGGETVGKVKDSIGILKQMKLTLSRARREAEMEIKQSYQAWRFSREEYFAMKEAVTAAEENYKLQSDEYRRSLVNNLDVLAALETLGQTRQSENIANFQMMQSEARLKVAAGEVS